MEEKSTSDNLPFNEKIRIFSYDYLKFCTYLTSHEESWEGFTKKFYVKLSSASQLLEDFLDYHGAKNNKKWYFYRELTAAVRHLSVSSNSQKHIESRLAFYSLPDTKDFEEEGRKTLTFINRALIKTAPVILDEARQLDIPIPDESLNRVDFHSVVTGELLDYDIDDQDQDEQKKHIVNIASELLDISRRFFPIELYKTYSLEEIREAVPRKVSEVEVRRFEMLLHNLQSSFDTYVIHGGYRFGNRQLKELRALFSVVLHLLHMSGRLLHFYERHLHEAGYKNTYKRVRDRLAALIDPDALLDRTVNYGVYYACHFLAVGREVARQVLNENIERSCISVGVPVKLGFHSRPSLLVAKIVRHYGGQVELRVGEDRFDASSVLDLQWAGGKIQKEKITEVVFEGDSRALADIKILAGVNYGEDIMGKDVPLPKELGYLK